MHIKSQLMDTGHWPLASGTLFYYFNHLPWSPAPSTFLSLSICPHLRSPFSAFCVLCPPFHSPCTITYDVWAKEANTIVPVTWIKVKVDGLLLMSHPKREKEKETHTYTYTHTQFACVHQWPGRKSTHGTKEWKKGKKSFHSSATRISRIRRQARKAFTNEEGEEEITSLTHTGKG